MKSSEFYHSLQSSSLTESDFPWNPEKGIAAKRPKRPGGKGPIPARRIPRRR